MTPEILPAALKDLEWGRDFYDRQGQGIGDYFIQSALSDIESLRLSAGIHSKRNGYYWLMVTRFPWIIYYTIENRVPVGYRVTRLQIPSRLATQRIKRTSRTLRFRLAIASNETVC